MKKSIEIEIPYPISTNCIYAGVHFSKRKRHKDYFSWAVRRVIKRAGHVHISNFPVDLEFIFYWEKRKDRRIFDSSNCSYMGKLIEDGLVKVKVIPNDSPKYVRRVTYESCKGDRDVCVVKIIENDCS